MVKRLSQRLGIKEPVNTWTHFITFLVAIGGLIYLMILSRNSVSKLITMTVYGVSLILLFGASSVYHWFSTTPQRARILRKIDHIAIYLLIAGSYTPVFYYGLSGAWRGAMLITVWLLTLVGVILKLGLAQLPRSVSTIFYISLGWIAVVPFVQLVQVLPLGAILLAIIGGMAYTIGAIIYATKRFNFFPNKFGFHEIFHIFVILGSASHFVMMVRYIVPL